MSARGGSTTFEEQVAAMTDAEIAGRLERLASHWAATPATAIFLRVASSRLRGSAPRRPGDSGTEDLGLRPAKVFRCKP